MKEENRKLIKMKLNEGVMFKHKQAEQLGNFGHVILSLSSKTEDEHYGEFLHNCGK